MSACEKCWRDASHLALTLGGSVSDHYQDLLRLRKDNPCSKAEQRGDPPVSGSTATPAKE